MKLLILSDLHLEFYTEPSGVVESFPKDGYDVVVLAGDIVSGVNSAEIIGQLCDHFAPHPIVFVRGNHELWRTRRQMYASMLCGIERRKSNFMWLENNEATILGKKFVGTTLWFSRSPFGDVQSYTWCDFKEIEDFRDWVYKANKEAMEFLRQSVTSDSVVVTHYLPTEHVVNEKYKGDPFNCFYVCDMERVILDKKPPLWIHGHTHHAVDCVVGDTRIVCNPRGYPREAGNGFSSSKIVEV